MPIKAIRPNQVARFVRKLGSLKTIIARAIDRVRHKYKLDLIGIKGQFELYFRTKIEFKIKDENKYNIDKTSVA